MFWRKLFRTPRMRNLNLKEIRIVLWDEVGPGAADKKPDLGYLAALSPNPPPDKAVNDSYNSQREGLVRPGITEKVAGPGCSP